MADKGDLSVAQLRVFFLLILVRLPAVQMCSFDNNCTDYMYTGTLQMYCCNGTCTLRPCPSNTTKCANDSDCPLMKFCCKSGECKARSEECLSNDTISSNLVIWIIVTVVGAILSVPTLVCVCLLCPFCLLYDRIRQGGRVLFVKHDSTEPYKVFQDMHIEIDDTVIHLPPPVCPQPVQNWPILYSPPLLYAIARTAIEHNWMPFWLHHESGQGLSIRRGRERPFVGKTLESRDAFHLAGLAGPNGQFLGAYHLTFEGGRGGGLEDLRKPLQ